MQAITTKYLGPTNSRGSRIKAWTESGHSITVPYPHEKHQGAEAHAVAAIALVQKLGWYGDLIAGGTDKGYVFVFAHSDRFETGVTHEQEREAFEAKIAALSA